MKDLLSLLYRLLPILAKQESGFRKHIGRRVRRKSRSRRERDNFSWDFSLFVLWFQTA